MFKIFLSFLIFSSFAFGISKKDLYKFYKNKDYKNVCLKGNYTIGKFRKDDKYLSLISLSCVNSDMINTALTISKFMKNSKMARNNASYIANLYLIKKLLTQFVYDKIDLSNLSLPKSNHFLSIIFENISHKNYKKQKNSIIIESKNKKYILKPLISDKDHKISISIIDKKTNKKTIHSFW